MSETWRKVPAIRMLGIPAGYQASSDANVRSTRKVLSQWLDKDGYPMVKVGGKSRRVATLVQLAFAGLPEVRHLNGDRSDAKPGNLAWGSRVENEGDKRRTGREEEDGRGCYRPSPPVTPVTGDLQR